MGIGLSTTERLGWQTQLRYALIVWRGGWLITENTENPD